MKKQLLIVDGYNMIGSWQELVLLKKLEQLEEARELLLFELSNYAKFEHLQVIVVFDAMHVPGISRSYDKYQLEVVFTGEGETADSYIERLAVEKNNVLTQVSVATSDLAEQWAIFSQGALRVSARELYQKVQTAKKNITGVALATQEQARRRNSPWSAGQLSVLEEMRKSLEK
ncbi:hypothetical protein SAMN02745116_00883 [Pilibacter termitis]|uniref:YacP-like NYN domain-containing protein n=1 Tax=Pilibacter termitis TaxID=263852 RepID=A0A1T4M066_9ENTE|nr:NYN domain-containing protein [Pilibacter termitis]SJZ60158.1 hypothetical protein SAMN02745116_00883 [Pilibacter termitis]